MHKGRLIAHIINNIILFTVFTDASVDVEKGEGLPEIEMIMKRTSQTQMNETIEMQ